MQTSGFRFTNAQYLVASADIVVSEMGGGQADTCATRQTHR